MKQMLTIAGGVFLGIAALLAVRTIPDIPRWIEENHHKNQEEAAAQIIRSLTPEETISRCGPPIADETQTSESVSYRTLSYEGTNSETMRVIFHRLSDRLVTVSLEDEFGLFQSNRERLTWLPCLSASN